MYHIDKFLSDESRFEKINSNLDSIKKSSEAELENIFIEKTELEFSPNQCLSCANCCRNYSPIILEEEIQTIQKELDVSYETLFQDYIEMDEDGDYVFISQPCPLLDLETNKCRIYENRPIACSEFPHTTNFPVKEHLDLLKINASICPAAYNILERASK